MSANTVSEKSQTENVDSELVDSDGFSAHEFYVICADNKSYQYFSHDDLEQFVDNKSYRIYSQLKEDCSVLDKGDFTLVRNSKSLRFVESYDSDIPKLKRAVSVGTDFKVTVAVQNRLLPEQHELWQSIPKFCTSARTLDRILTAVSRLKVCVGNPDKDWQTLIPFGAYLDTNSGLKYQGYRDGYLGSTIRSTNCLGLSAGERCLSCQKYRGTLRKTLLRKENSDIVSTPQKNWLSSKKPNNRLTDSQKFHKLKQMRSYVTDLERENEKLKRDIQRLIQKDGVRLSKEDSADMLNLMKDSDIAAAYPDENSYQRLFWKEQLKVNSLKDKRGMRWHPMIIKWCVFLKSKSSTTYDALRKSGFVTLPSERTLFDYTNYIQKGCGFQSDIITMLHNEIYGSKKFEQHQTIVGLLHDEIRIKSDLVYNKHSGELIGFLDLGGIGNDIQNMEESVKKENKPLARYVLVLMVRGVSSNIKFPLAHFATNGVTSDQLFPILWEGVEILEVDLSLKVLFITSDGASPNRRFIRLHKVGGQAEVVYRADNIFASEDRYIYFFSDAPHLIKTARNCVSNSYSHRKSRKMWKDGKDISWVHIVNLFKDHCSGLYRRCPKLTKSHIDITAFSCMKVSYAAQVLSSTVANAIEMLYGDETTETVMFIRHMNKFFDCLNTRSFNEAVKSRNDNVKPFSSADDPRLNYLLEDFLGYFSDWKRSVDNRPGNFTKGERSGMQLSYQTIEGIEITVRSVVECVRYCLSEGMSFVLTNRFNQDPIEQHFGLQRFGGGCNNNPTLDKFNNTMVRLRTAGSQAIAPFSGNTKRVLEFAPVDNTVLPKRKRTATV